MQDQKYRRRRRRILFFFAKILVVFLLLFGVGAVYAEAPIVQKVVSSLKPTPKPLVESEEALPAEVQAAIETLAKEETISEEPQELYEITQLLTQHIFAGGAAGARIERKLPNKIRREIVKLKRNLPEHHIPQLILPEGVVLPKIAVLPHSVQHAIVEAAKLRIRDSQKTAAVKLDLTLTAKDLDVPDPKVLPGSFWYPVKRLFRGVSLLLTFEPLDRLEKLIVGSNERTLEAAKLLEGTPSRRNIDLALANLAKVERDFGRLKGSTEKIDALRQKAPERVEGIINSIIKNGLARQTVFALIEDRVYGADYVAVEKIRQNVLRSGIDSLLSLSGGDAQSLVERLENAVNEGEGSVFKELKAIELLVEIKRFEPEKIDEILQASEIRLVRAFEKKLLTIDKATREKELLAYVESLPGNPVRQFEAFEEIKEIFTNSQTRSLVEKLEDAATKNLVEVISGITDSTTLEEFAREVVGNQAQDLEVVVEAEVRLDEVPSILEEQIETIVAIVKEEVIQEVGEKAVNDIVSEVQESAGNLPSIIPQTPQEETILEETVAEVQEEILSAPSSTISVVEETLPEPIQDEIEEIRQEAPAEQLSETPVSIDEPVTTVEEIQTPVEETVPAPPPAPTLPGL